MPVNPFLLDVARRSVMAKQAFIPAQGQPPADGSAPPQGGAPAPQGGAPAPQGGAPAPQGGAPAPAPAPGGDPSQGGAPPMGGPDPGLMQMVQNAVQQHMATQGGGAGGAKRGGGGAGKHDETAHQLYKGNQLQVAIANALGVQIPNEAILGPPPGTDPSMLMAGGQPGQDPNAQAQAQPGQDPNAQAQPQAAPPINFMPSVAQQQPKMAMEEMADRMGTPINEPHLVPVMVPIPVLDMLKLQAADEMAKTAAANPKPNLRQTSSTAQAIRHLMEAMN